MGKNETFSDRLTPGQIQTVLDSLHIPWRNHNWQGNDGWVNVSHPDFQSDLSVNVYHGGWVDQYYKSHGEERPEGGPASGDFVSLVAALEYLPGQYTKAIEYIKGVCGMAAGMKPPDVPEGYCMANEFLGREKANFVRIPPEIWGSNLRPSEKIVWAAIFDRCNDGLFSFPGVRRIADDTGLDKSTVSKAITRLTEYGLILEKYRGVNKAPAKFPLVAEKEVINQAIIDAKKRTTKKPAKACCTQKPYRGVEKSVQGVLKKPYIIRPITTIPKELYPNSYKGKGGLCPRPFSETHGKAV